MEEEVDSSKPFQDVVVCCTSIPPDQRTEIAQRTSDMGGTHKYDLTPDVTHLIVGDYDTPKYRHVAKERPDITPMAAGWIEDARNMWMADQEFDFAALEAKWKLKTFESSGGIPNSTDPAQRERSRLLCCLTGFEDHDMRTRIEEKVKANGGEYVGDLSRSVTHLITCKPEGKKYLAALRWDIRTVSIEWLNDSVERGMILNESCYDPTLPQEERGVGAWTRKEIRRDTTGKRLRDDAALAAAQGRRKLRKTASMKFNSQSESLWGDILNQQSPANRPTIVSEDQADVSHISLNESVISRKEDSASSALPLLKDHERPEGGGGVFASCRFFVHGFNQDQASITYEYLTSHGGRISSSIDDVASPTHAEPATQRFLVVPQASQPDSHPGLPEGVQIVTEFYIERCLHGKRLCDPADHVLGRPFPRFPIDGFGGLVICGTGFVNERLNQIEKTVVQLGATYSEKFNGRVSLLVSAEPGLESIARQKRDYARVHGIPIVDAEWVWQCIATGFRVPWDEYILQKPDPKAAKSQRDDEAAKEQQQQQQQEKRKLKKRLSEPMPTKLKPKPFDARASLSGGAWVDRSGFQDDGKEPRVPKPAEESRIPPQNEVDESHYETAPTQPLEATEVGHRDGPTVLREASSNILNKSPPSPQKATTTTTTTAPPDPPQKAGHHRQLKRFPTGGTIADSDTADDNSQAPATTNSRQGTEEAPPQQVVAADREAADEEEKEAAAAAAAGRKRQLDREREKQEMSRRLSSLMSSHNSSNNNSINEGNSTINIATGGSGEGTATTTTAGAGAGAQRRKRKVLGRAISNVSAASSNASADSSAVAIDPAHSASINGKSKAAARSGSIGAGVDASFASAGSGSGLQQLFDNSGGRVEQREKPPPATQLGYDNPEARQHRAAIMDRILRKSGGGGGGDGGKKLPSQENKVKKTLASVEVREGAGRGGGGGGAGVSSSITSVATRRTTRRQKGF